MCILKHKFDYAIKMLDMKESIWGPVNPHITNSNGSNSIHILFANFNTDEDKA